MRRWSGRVLLQLRLRYRLRSGFATLPMDALETGVKARPARAIRTCGGRVWRLDSQGWFLRLSVCLDRYLGQCRIRGPGRRLIIVAKPHGALFSVVGNHGLHGPRVEAQVQGDEAHVVLIGLAPLIVCTSLVSAFSTETSSFAPSTSQLVK